MVVVLVVWCPSSSFHPPAKTYFIGVLSSSVGESGGDTLLMTEEERNEEGFGKNDYHPHLHHLHRIRRQKKRGKDLGRHLCPSLS